MDFTHILTKRYPGEQWTLNGDHYVGLEWLSESTKPTEKALKKLWPSVEAEIAAEAQAKLDAKASAISKLEALGLTVDEIQEAFGLQS